MKKTVQLGNVSVKLIAALFVVICLAIGAVGIVLPIIPGLLFLALAALIVTRHFPSTEFWLRKSRTMDAYLDKTEGFFELDFRHKLKLGALLCAKMLIDGIAYVVASVRKFVNRPGF